MFAAAVSKFGLTEGSPKSTKGDDLNYAATDTASQAKLGSVDETDSLLPKPVLSFEHSEKYYGETKKLLNNASLKHLVNLVHAPLEDTIIDDGNFLYYDCDTALTKLAEALRGRKAKILVLVDGPPGSTGPRARLPAMNKIIDALGSHHIDLVLDDYYRSEEKAVGKQWMEFLESRGVSFESNIYHCEKGACFFHINN